MFNYITYVYVIIIFQRHVFKVLFFTHATFIIDPRLLPGIEVMIQSGFATRLLYDRIDDSP